MRLSTDATTTIGVNLLWLQPGEVGGSEEYTVRLLRAVHASAPADLRIVLYVDPRFPDAHPDLAAAFPIRVAPLRGASRVVRVAMESTWLAWRTRRDHCAIVHHAGGTMPAIRTVPGMVTLHDLQPLTHPERFGIVKRTYIRFVAPRSLRAAERVVCLSTFTADDAVERAGVDPGRIALVPCGVADPGVLRDRGSIAELRRRLGLGDRRIVLYPAITYPHKNHETLVSAFAEVHRSRPDTVLVLTGGEGPSESVVRSAIAAHDLDAAVVRTGRIQEADLDLLYRDAVVMAFPSSYEGFGLPALEAMARGCAVVASDVGGLASVVGDAAIRVDPHDVAGWVEALGSLIDDPARRSVLVRSGFARVGSFAWPDSAAALIDTYREFG